MSEKDDYYNIVKILLEEIMNIPNSWKENLYINMKQRKIYKENYGE